MGNLEKRMTEVRRLLKNASDTPGPGEKKQLGLATLRLLDAFQEELEVQKGRSSFTHRPQAFDTTYLTKVGQADRSKVHGASPDVDEQWRQKTAAPKPSADVAKVFDNSSPEAATASVEAQRRSAAQHGASLSVRQSEAVGGPQKAAGRVTAQATPVPNAEPRSVAKPRTSSGLDANVGPKPEQSFSGWMAHDGEPRPMQLRNEFTGARVEGVTHPMGANTKPAGDEDVPDENGPTARRTPPTDSESATGNPRAAKLGDPNPTGGRIVHPRYHRR